MHLILNTLYKLAKSSNLAVTGYRGKHLSAVERDGLMFNLREYMFTVLVILWGGGQGEDVNNFSPGYQNHFYPTHMILIFVEEDQITF